MLRNRSGNFPKKWPRKPEPIRHRSQDDSYSDVLYPLEQLLSWLRPGGDLSYCGGSSRRESLLLSWAFIRYTKEDALHKSALTSQRQHPFDNRSTLDFVGTSKIRKQATSFFPTSTLPSTEFQNCPNPSRQQCPPSTRNPEKLNCFEDLFQKNSKNQYYFTEEDKTNFFTLSCAVMRCRQKHQQPEQKKIGRNPDSDPRKLRENAISDYGRTQTSFISVQFSEPEISWLFGRTPETSKGRIRSRRSSDHRAIRICQNASLPGK